MVSFITKDKTNIPAYLDLKFDFFRNDLIIQEQTVSVEGNLKKNQSYEISFNTAVEFDSYTLIDY